MEHIFSPEEEVGREFLKVWRIVKPSFIACNVGIPFNLSDPFTMALFKLLYALKPPGESWYIVSYDFITLGWGLRFCISNTLPSGIGAAGPGTKL